MECQRTINMSLNTSNQNLEQKIGFKEKMNQEEHTIVIVRSNLKLQFKILVMIIVMHTY